MKFKYKVIASLNTLDLLEFRESLSESFKVNISRQIEDFVDIFSLNIELILVLQDLFIPDEIET